jgi:hypothetical protein
LTDTEHARDAAVRAALAAALGQTTPYRGTREPGTPGDDALIEELADAVSDAHLAVVDLEGVKVGAVVVDPTAAAAAVLDALDAVGLYPRWGARRSPETPQDTQVRPPAPPDPTQAPTAAHAPARTIDDGQVIEVTVLLDADRSPADAIDIIERSICPDPEEQNHFDTCPLLTVSSRPLVSNPDVFDRDPAARAWARARVQRVIDRVDRMAGLYRRHPSTDPRIVAEIAELVTYTSRLRRDLVDGGSHYPAAFEDPDPRDQEPTP